VENKTPEDITKTPPSSTRKHASLFFDQIPSHIPDSAIFLIDSMLKVYDNLQVEIDRIEERMKIYMRGYERKLNILMSVSGIGFVISSNLLAEIGDINNFLSSDKHAKWAGIAPSVYQSANTYQTGSITKQGSKYLRGALVEAAHSAIKRPGKLNDYINSLLPRIGYKKAIVTVAHKILRIVWHLLVKDEMYVETILIVNNSQISKLPDNIEKIE